MKKAIKAIFISIFTVCLNINYVTAVPFPAIEEFVTPDGPNKIYQVPNSKWCVPTCTDLASVYISRISGADPTDVSVQLGVTPPDTSERYLEVYNPDPTYGGPNPMIVDPSLSYRGRSIKTPVGIQKVVSRYMVIKYQREE